MVKYLFLLVLIYPQLSFSRKNQSCSQSADNIFNLKTREYIKKAEWYSFDSDIELETCVNDFPTHFVTTSNIERNFLEDRKNNSVIWPSPNGDVYLVKCKSLTPNSGCDKFYDDQGKINNLYPRMIIGKVVSEELIQDKLIRIKQYEIKFFENFVVSEIGVEKSYFYDHGPLFDSHLTKRWGISGEIKIYGPENVLFQRISFFDDRVGLKDILWIPAP